MCCGIIWSISAFSKHETKGKYWKIALLSVYGFPVSFSISCRGQKCGTVLLLLLFFLTEFPLPAPTSSTTKQCSTTVALSSTLWKTWLQFGQVWFHQSLCNLCAVFGQVWFHQSLCNLCAVCGQVWFHQSLCNSCAVFGQVWFHQSLCNSCAVFGQVWFHQSLCNSCAVFGKVWFHQSLCNSCAVFGQVWFHQSLRNSCAVFAGVSASSAALVGAV